MILYADSNSGRPLHPEVAEKISSLLGQNVSNPSQVLSPLGKRAKELVELARSQVAEFVNAKPEEVVFTSGGTESCFQAIVGTFLAKNSSNKPNANKIVSSALEHPAVTQAINTLASLSVIRQEIVQSDKSGQISIEDFIRKIDQNAFLVNLMAANNETGVCFDWPELASFCSKQEVTYHCDLTQWLGKLPFSFQSSNLSLASFSAHKIGGPQGIGALLVKAGTRWTAVMPGGGQEQGRRGGTESVIAIAAFGEAARINKKPLNSEPREVFEKALTLSGTHFVGSATKRLPNTSMLVIDDVAADALVKALAEKNIIVASGAACSQGAGSKVLQAMGYSERQARSAIRVSFLPEATKEQARVVAAAIIEEATKIREKNIQELKDVYQG